MKQQPFSLGCAWAAGTTALYTVLVFFPILACLLFSRSGRSPFLFGRIWSWLVLKTNRVRVAVCGREHVDPDASYVFIANHASHLDSTAIALALPHTLRFIGKKSLSRIPVFGWASRRIGIIYIDRQNRQKAIETLRQEAGSLKNGVSTLFYAEGTRSVDGQLQAFKKGGAIFAIQTGLPVVPLTVAGSHRLMPKYATRIRPGTITVYIGRPISTIGLSQDDRDDLIDQVRGEIQQQLDGHGRAAGATVCQCPVPALDPPVE